MIIALSTLNSWGSSTKNIFAAVKTPCANTPLLSALNSFPSKTLLIQFLRRPAASVPRPRRDATLLAAAHRQDLGGRPPLTCPDCGGRDEDSGLHRGGPRYRKNSQASGLLPDARAVRPSRSPSTSRSTTTCPPWKTKTLSPSPSERPKSLRRRPVLLPGARPGHPEEAPKRARTSERSPKRR